MSYGFCCGYCEREFEGPDDDAETAYKAGQEAGWRFTWGPTRRWGDGANYTCPDCIAPSEKETATPIWVDPAQVV